VRAKITKQLSKNLRKNQTKAEIKIWRYLKNRALAGYKFRRQCPIGPYIVDFVCFERMVVLEIDGGQHADQTHRDARRTEYLKSRGFKVIRFWNNEVLGDTDSVLSVIQATLINSPSSPAIPAGVREYPAHPFGGADVHRTSATTPSHLPKGEGSMAILAQSVNNICTADDEYSPSPNGRGQG
jgi:very-short-patch-repair endonuclease